MVFIDNNSPLMKEIVSLKDKYKVEAVNAIVKDNTIIPGVNGREINKRKSLIKMEENGSFNENLLIYDIINPVVSINNNIDKIIIKGNPLKRGVSLILEKNEELEDYLSDNNIKYDILAKLDTNLDDKTREYINSESLIEKYSDLNALLNKKKINNKICFLNYSNLNYCQKNKYYLVTYSLNSFDKYSLISNIDSGDIILINSYTSIDTLKLVLSEIKKMDLDILYLSDLIKE